MADQTYAIRITDGGTADQLVNTLKQLGVAGDDAFDRVSKGMLRMSTSAQGAQANTLLLNNATKLGFKNADELANALDHLNNAELKAAAQAAGLTNSINTQAAAFKKHVAGANSSTEAVSANTLAMANSTKAIAENKAAVGLAASSWHGFASAVGGLTVLFGTHELKEASDQWVDFSNNVKLATSQATNAGGSMKKLTGTIGAMHTNLNTLTEQTDRQREAEKALVAQAEKTGQAPEALSDLFKSVANSANTAGLAQDELLNATITVSNTLQAAGASGQHTANAMNELTTAFQSGALEGQQLQSIMSNLPALLQPIANVRFGGNMGLLMASLKNGATDASISLREYVNALNASSQSAADAAAKMTVTIGQALATLHTRWMVFLNDGKVATSIQRGLVAVINGLGQSLSAVVPAIAALAAAWASVKIASIASEFTALLATLSGFVVLNPVAAVVIGIAAAVAGVISYFGQWGTVIGVIQSAWQAFASAISPVLTAIGGYVQPVIQYLQQIGAAIMAMLPSWDQLKAVASSVGQALLPIWQAIQPSLQSVWDAVKGLVAAYGELYTALQPLGAYIQSSLVTYFQWWNEQLGNSDSTISRLVSSVGILMGWLAKVAAFVASTLVTAFSGWISTISFAINIMTKLINLATQWSSSKTSVDYKSPAPMLYDNGTGFRDGGVIYARDGYSWTVPGAGPVDSVPVHMRVSPGEQIIVRTRQQQATSYGFAGGGSVNLGTQAIPPLLPSLEANAPANDNLNKSADTLAQSSVSSASAISASSKVSAEAIKSATSAFEEATTQSVTAFEQAAKTIADAVTETAAPSASATSASLSSAGRSVSSSSSGGGSYGTTSSGGIDYTSKGAYETTKAQADTAKKAQLKFSGLNLYDASYTGMTNAQQSVQIYIDTSSGQFTDASGNQLSGNWYDVRPGSYSGIGTIKTYDLSGGISGGSITSKTVGSPQAGTGGKVTVAPIIEGLPNWRDGGDYMIPGAGAVDSRMVSAMVSPGEVISVRTRRQQTQDDGSSSSSKPTINMTVITKDANSFKQSDAQLTRQLTKSVMRASRK